MYRKLVPPSPLLAELEGGAVFRLAQVDQACCSAGEGARGALATMLSPVTCRLCRHQVAKEKGRESSESRRRSCVMGVMEWNAGGGGLGGPFER